MTNDRGQAQVLRTEPGRQMLRRALVLAALFGVGLFALLLGRLAQLQIAEHDRFEQMALQQQLRQTPSSVSRGDIYDRNGRPLAVSASVENVYLSPAEIQAYGEDPELIARGLSEILGLDYEEVLEKAGRTGSWYVTVARKLERETADQVRQFKNEHGLRGLRLETDSKRYYPNGSLACHLIGFVGQDNNGLEGIEARYDEELSGSAGKTVRATNAFGTQLLFWQYEDYYPGQDGLDLVTSIDSTIQYYVEKHLNQAVADYDIQNGAGAIAMDVNTGEILAMASLGSYDLNDFLAVDPEVLAQIEQAPEAEREGLLQEARARQWRNKALSDTYEPGSTFKIITLSMALEEGAVSLNDSFYCGGSVTVKGRTTPIRCWKTQGHGSQTLTQAVQHSCNAAFVNIGQRVGAEAFYDYCEAFGFLNKTGDPDENLTATTGIDIAGESGSIWWSENTFCSPKNLSQLAAASFGQTFTITPLQLITAVSACVNGGKLMQPYVVRQLLRPDGSVAYEREPTVVRQVISAETSARVRSILEQVVGDPKDGTGRNAAVAGYRIGGKTGTSEKVSLEARTGQKQYIVSFVGFAPADEPKIAILCFLDTPSDASGVYVSGGQMAAPVVGAMMADILPYLGVEPDREKLSDVRVPDCLGLSLKEAALRLDEAGLRYRSIGDGDTVTDQLPPAGARIGAGTEIILYRGAEVSPELENMPALQNLSYEDARDLMAAYGLYLRSLSPVQPDGNQRIGSQSIPAGTLLRHGTVVTVSLLSTDQEMLGIYLRGESPEEPMKLKELIRDLTILETTADPEQEITGVAYDSRLVEKGNLFVAVKGFASDGHRFIPKALEKGAAAILCQDAPGEGVPFLRIADTRLGLALVSRAFFGDPASKMCMIGFTGTNGKTTSSYLMKHLLEETLGAKVGLIGTNGIMIGQKFLPSERTTPESYELHSLFRRMLDAGCSHVVMEVSSHSLSLERVAGITFDVGLFTNLTQDHLDFHGSMEEYAAAKRKLFGQCRVGCFNLDDPWAPYMMEGAACRCLGYSAQSNDADLVAKDVRLSADGVRFAAVTGEGLCLTRLGIPGMFSVHNALGVLTAGIALGISLEDCCRAMDTAKGVKGRVEVVPTGRDFSVLIDYAHTPDALENVLVTLRDVTRGRLIVLFGCGGDRDALKRPIMGRIAAENADLCVVTSDNPRTEDPQAIIDGILAGMKNSRTPTKVIVDRPKAIAWAIDNARPGDVILLAGKGHEDYQEVNHVKHHMDEREIVADCLKN